MMLLYVPDAEEIRVSPAISRKGFLHFLDESTNGWVKRWVVVRRPYLFLYNNEKDPLERGIINLSSAQIEYNEERGIRGANTFSICTKTRGFLLQTLGEKEIHDWLYAINPLLAGTIRSKLNKKTKSAPTSAATTPSSHTPSAVPAGGGGAAAAGAAAASPGSIPSTA